MNIAARISPIRLCAPRPTTTDKIPADVINEPVSNPNKYNEELENGAIDDKSLQRRIDSKHEALNLIQSSIDQMYKVRDKAFQSGTEDQQRDIQEKIDRLKEKFNNIRLAKQELEDELREQKINRVD